jgi:hypothetical protein
MITASACVIPVRFSCFARAMSAAWSTVSCGIGATTVINSEGRLAIFVFNAVFGF